MLTSLAVLVVPHVHFFHACACVRSHLTESLFDAIAIKKGLPRWPRMVHERSYHLDVRDVMTPISAVGGLGDRHRPAADTGTAHAHTHMSRRVTLDSLRAILQSGLPSSQV